MPFKWDVITWKNFAIGNAEKKSLVGMGLTLSGIIKFSTSDNAILAFSSGSLDLGYQLLYLHMTLYGNECGKCRSA